MYAAENETRPPLVFDRISDLELSSVRGQLRNSAAPLAHLRNLENGFAAFCSLTGSTGPVFESEGPVPLKLTATFLQSGQREMTNEPELKDQSFFEDFQTDLKYTVEKGETVKGLTAASLTDNPVRFTLNMTKRGSIQICLLVFNRSEKPERVVVKYEGITQEFLVNWHDWGWAPITLLKEFPEDKNVDFVIEPMEKGSGLVLSRVYFRYQDVRKTD
jgi:hypothetical protein